MDTVSKITEAVFSEAASTISIQTTEYKINTSHESEEPEYSSNITLEFKYQPPESLKDVIWYSDYIEKEIKYEYYKNDENITKYLPQQIVDDFSAYVKTQETDPLTWFGVMLYDMNDDDNEDYLVLARTRADYDMINSDEPFFPSSHDFSAIYLNNSYDYHRIDRYSYSHYTYNYDYNGNDGFILSKKTNGVNDIFMDINLGYTISYDGYLNYQPEVLYYDNFFYHQTMISNGICKLNFDKMSFEGFESDNESYYYVYLKLRQPNPLEYDILYSSDETGTPIIYKAGFPVDYDGIVSVDNNDCMNYDFYAPISDMDLYQEFYEYNLTAMEIKYVSI
jgi:hypothetical protein